MKKISTRKTDQSIADLEKQGKFVRNVRCPVCRAKLMEALSGERTHIRIKCKGCGNILDVEF